MKTLSFFSSIIFLISSGLNAQNNWTWINGSSTVTVMVPVFGTQGVGASTNTPGNRENAITWTDDNGNFWLFGGYNSTYIFMGDLWKYDPSTNEWAWMKGPAGSGGNGVYGTLGVSAPANRPGGRAWSAGWKDTNGDLWLYGGYGYSATSTNVDMGDLWKYTLSTNQWTWMGGSNAWSACVPGTQGVPAPTNSPGSRIFFNTATDASGNFWLFGGNGYVSSGGQTLNDLWKYDVSTNNWTWMKGSTTGSVVGTYGTMGVPAPSNDPGSRVKSSLVSDKVNNSLYLFHGLAPGSSNGTNDMWRYDIGTGNWTWLKGSSGAATPASYGTMGISSSSNMPPMRYTWGSSSYFIDNNENIWTFGGIQGTTGFFNDLWRYSILKNEWTWMKGSNLNNQTGIYGTLGTAAAVNIPGARYGQAGWKDQTGKLWIYGGSGYNANGQAVLNDLWKLDICDAPESPKTSTVTPASAICTGSSAIVVATSTVGAVFWYSSLTSTNSLYNGAAFQTPLLTATGAPSYYTYYAETAIGTCKSYSRTAVTVTVYPQPVISAVPLTPTICLGETASINFSGALSFTCMAQTINYISPAGNFSIIPEASSTYTLIGESQHGCRDTIQFTQMLDLCTQVEKIAGEDATCIFPNPHKNEFVIRCKGFQNGISFELVSPTGQVLMRQELTSANQTIDTHVFDKGIYYLKIIKENKAADVLKLLKTE